ncbi:hypothetical protein CUMW_288190 [Citrus unshiu]|uniref:Uncharacterized protein n=1 Tax=Citrus unshiu TaxID=55188 RepID=A0A2H5N112_CITUN|nr:hypothetical protein CUMW_288190 [Citrus unshiu]
MAKSESPDIEVGKMYFCYTDHFPGRISSMCMLSSVVKAIEEKLTKRQLSMFKKNIFGHFLECRSFPFSGVWIYDSLLTFRDDKRYKLKFKPLEVIFPRWLEYVGFYNIRPELRSEDPWKVIAVKSAPQQEPKTGDCDLCSNFNVEI